MVVAVAAARTDRNVTQLLQLRKPRGARFAPLLVFWETESVVCAKFERRSTSKARLGFI
jgi:hypothetical protein